MPRKVTEDELKLINQFYTQKELTVDDLMVMDVVGAIAGVQTAYFSYLTPRSIQNFVMDVNGKLRSKDAPSVGYYLNHDTTSRLPLGVLFDANESGEEQDLEFRHKVFLPLNYSTGDVTVEDYIKSVEMGMSEQVSVGFISNKLTCRICGDDIRSFKCPHMPGGRYNVGTEEEPKFVVCSYDVDEARLMEVSAAWRGALPGARILSIDNQDGRQVQKPVDVKSFAEGTTLRFNCSGEGSIELVGDMDLEIENQGGILMDVKKPIEEEVVGGAGDLSLEEALELVTALTAEKDLLTVQVLDLKTDVKSLNDELDDVDAQRVGLEDLLAIANESLATFKPIAEAYMTEVYSEIHKLAVGVDAELYKKEELDAVLEKMSLEEQKSYRDSLRAKLSKLFVGRLPIDEGSTSSCNIADFIDPSVYRAGR